MSKKNKLTVWFILRLLIGLVFTVSGFEKIIAPYQNFLYVIESYDIVPSFFALWVARVFPWFELLTGLFLVLGLWFKQALFAASGMISCFIIIVGQALLRKLPIDDCGCFGDMVHFPLHVMFLFDISLLFITLLLIYNEKKANHLSLDRMFEQADSA